MSKILAVKPITTKAGRPMVIVSTIEKDHFVSRSQWSGHALSDVFDAYVGGEFDSDYYQKGDLLLDGVTVVEDSNVILRDFSASMNPVVTATIAATLIAQQSNQAKEQSALFARKRAEETPEQATARREAALAARLARATKAADPIEA